MINIWFTIGFYNHGGTPIAGCFFFLGKISSRNGWWLGVALWLRKPPNMLFQMWFLGGARSHLLILTPLCWPESGRYKDATDVMFFLETPRLKQFFFFSSKCQAPSDFDEHLMFDDLDQQLVYCWNTHTHMLAICNRDRHLIWGDMEVSIVMGVPPWIIHFSGIFPNKNHPAIGVPPWRAGNPQNFAGGYPGRPRGGGQLRPKQLWQFFVMMKSDEMCVLIHNDPRKTIEKTH